jgi:hypothetical protein
VELVVEELDHIQVHQQELEQLTLVVAVEVVVKLVDHQVLQVLVEQVVKVSWLREHQLVE